MTVISTEVQLDIDGIEAPSFQLAIRSIDHQGVVIDHQNHKTILESLEYKGVSIPSQCRSGYCGACRTKLVRGSVHYIESPLAAISEDEFLPCCTVPKTDLLVELKTLSKVVRTHDTER